MEQLINKRTLTIAAAIFTGLVLITFIWLVFFYAPKNDAEVAEPALIDQQKIKQNQGAKVENENITLQESRSPDIPAAIPGVVPFYANATMVEIGGISATDGDDTWVMRFKTPDALIKVKNFYIKELSQGNWTMTQNDENRIRGLYRGGEIEAALVLPENVDINKTKDNFYKIVVKQKIK